MTQRGTLKLSDARILAPKPEGIGAYAEKLRSAAYNAIAEDDVNALMKTMIERAKKGDTAAAKFVMGFIAGGEVHRPTATHILSQIS
jgi:hypothetical protein